MKPTDLPNRMEDSVNQVPEELNQNMVTTETVSSALPKNIDRLKSFTEDLETIQQPRTSGHSSILFEKVILKPHCVFCNKEGRRKIKEKGVWTTEATTVFECQCLKL